MKTILLFYCLICIIFAYVLHKNKNIKKKKIFFMFYLFRDLKSDK